MTLDDVIPAPHFSERHERRIAAPPGAVWTALHELRVGDPPIASALMGVRMLPARILGGRERAPATGRPFLEQTPVRLVARRASEVTGSEVTGSGGLGPSGGARP